MKLLEYAIEGIAAYAFFINHAILICLCLITYRSLKIHISYGGKNNASRQRGLHPLIIIMEHLHMYSKIEYYFDIIFEEKNYSKIVFGVVSGKAGRVQGPLAKGQRKKDIEY